MARSFYSSSSYKQRQSFITHNNWLNGKLDSIRTPLTLKNCSNPHCLNTFLVKSYDPKKFCSHNCSASITNVGKKHSLETILKISQSVKKNHSHQSRRQTKYIQIICLNPSCRKIIILPPYLAKKGKYCSNLCAMKIIGSQTTSPKASKGKSGIRKDIDQSVCFYSTWEANLARVYNLTGTKWHYAPKIFELITHRYRPDFYLPYLQKYIEVKNYMNQASFERDQLFRRLYPIIPLDIISRTEYEELERIYKPFIKNWE